MQMLERLQRFSAGIAGLPSVKLGSPSAFFHDLSRDTSKLLTWSGELYFEKHRGTYTSQAKNKYWNRKCEVLLHDIECLFAFAALQNRLENYPQEEIARLWKLLLLNQFHDVLPGSSIGLVYKDSDAHYRDIQTSGAKLIDVAVSLLVGPFRAEPNASCLIACNTLPFARSEVVSLGSDSLALIDAPAMGFTVLPTPTGAPAGDVTCTRTEGGLFALENTWLYAEIDARDGTVVTLCAKAEPEAGQPQRRSQSAVPRGRHANRFVIYDDTPNYWDNWDLDAFHLEKPITVDAESHTFVEQTDCGPLRASLRVQIQLTRKCNIIQVISLSANSRRLEFHLQVDWTEAHRVLKVEFPVNVHTPVATYETQFGSVQRATNTNTSWEAARFEVCGHKWADLSEHGFGMALLNDSKYGYSARQNTLWLTLLRAGKMPDENADMGTHSFAYAAVPHFGSLQESGVIEEAAAFNDPLIVRPAQLHGFAQQPQSFQLVTHRSAEGQMAVGVMLDTLKLADDYEESKQKRVVARFYECHGGSHDTRLFVLNATRIEEVNLLEEDPRPVPDAQLHFSPFQLRTVAFTLSE
eukprot:TRINITY_DN3344_c0_g1_i7.p1 TRINITY_DN3344_c0_g1~~TRINITY_DN3344_c0_g1_i7.p1  ORF type:complete len:580 (-),score=122.52 TRINITY_DN3344_c0_g1_i7:792-2531(-)